MHVAQTWSKRTVIRAAGAPIILMAVVASHVMLRASSDLTPWKGGGFGMFSTVDSPGTRLVRVYLHGDLGSTEVSVPAQLRALADEVRAAPSFDRVTRLARDLAEQVWVAPRLRTAEGNQSDEADALDRLAFQAMALVLPVDTIRAVDGGDPDDRYQRQITVTSAEVVVLRLTSRGDGRQEMVAPQEIRRASATARPRIASGP